MLHNGGDNSQTTTKTTNINPINSTTTILNPLTSKKLTTELNENDTNQLENNFNKISISDNTGELKDQNDEEKESDDDASNDPGYILRQC